MARVDSTHTQAGTYSTSQVFCRVAAKHGSLTKIIIKWKVIKMSRLYNHRTMKCSSHLSLKISYWTGKISHSSRCILISLLAPYLSFLFWIQAPVGWQGDGHQRLTGIGAPRSK